MMESTMTSDPLPALDQPLQARVVFYTPRDQALPALSIEHLRLDGLSEQQILLAVDRHLQQELPRHRLAPARWLTDDPAAQRVLVIDAEPEADSPRPPTRSTQSAEPALLALVYVRTAPTAET
jgi:hypothetical protein